MPGRIGSCTELCWRSELQRCQRWRECEKAHIAYANPQVEVFELGQAGKFCRIYVPLVQHLISVVRCK